VRLNSPVLRVHREPDGSFAVTTPTEVLSARQVVVATGPFQTPSTPAFSVRILDAAIHVWDLARAISADETLGDDVVAFLLASTDHLDLDSGRDSFAPADADGPRYASPQDQLLHSAGPTPDHHRGGAMSDTEQFWRR
jgi:hypothetical protein